MGIEYGFEVRDGVLQVQAWGEDDSLEDVTGYGLAVIQAARANGCNRVLCEEQQLRYRLGTLDIHRSAAFMAEQAPDVARVAIVPPPEAADDAHFWETVAVNRGLQVRMFRDPEQARAWVTQAG